MKKDTPKRWLIKYVYWLFFQHLPLTLFNWFSIWFQWRRRRTLYNIFVSHLVVAVVVVVTSATSKEKKTTLIAAMSASEYLTKNVSVTVAVSVSEGVNCDCIRSSFWKFFVPLLKYFIWFRVMVALAGGFRFLFIELWLPDSNSDSNSRGCYDWGVACRASFKHIETCVFVSWCMRAVCSLCYTALGTIIWFIYTQLYDIYRFEVSDCQWVSNWSWYWELSDRWACGYAICVWTVNIEFSMRVTPPSSIRVCVASQHRGSELGI